MALTFTFQLSEADCTKLGLPVTAITRNSSFVLQNYQMERAASSLHYASTKWRIMLLINQTTTRRNMKKLAYLISFLLVLAPATQTLGQKTDNTLRNIEHAKKSVAKLGVGSKARATITLNDGSKVKGYVYSAGDEDFVIRDRKTDASTTIKYADVKSVDDNRGHSNARIVLIAVGIGAAVTIAAVFGAILRNER